MMMMTKQSDDYYVDSSKCDATFSITFINDSHVNIIIFCLMSNYSNTYIESREGGFIDKNKSHI